MLDISTEPLSRLAEHARISTAFRVARAFEVRNETRNARPVLEERAVAAPYIKDYDAIPGNAPADWLVRFDTSHWTLFSAWLAGERVGGAVVARRTPELQKRNDVALLWDLRVDPRHRARGIGSALLRVVEIWAQANACAELRIETQTSNVAACRLYQSRGCTLLSVDRFAYPELPDEVRLIWQKDLIAGSAAR